MSDEGAPSTQGPTLVPARMVNEHVYCPRLAWLEWEARAFADSDDTVEGRDDHRRVDRPRGNPRAPEAEVAPWEATAVTLASERLGIVAKLDRVVTDDGAVIPVETKHGRPRTGDGPPVWEPELAQITAQALLLREAGHSVPHAEVYFPATRTRHRIELPEDAEEWIAGLVREIHANAAHPVPPPPLVDSPKCPRCSLVGICLPDESNLLAERVSERPRRLVVGDRPATPLYVTRPGARVGKRGGRLVLEKDGERLDERRMIDVSQLALFGNVSVSAAALRACMDAQVPVLWFTGGGWYLGHAVAHGGSWVQRRIAQHARAASGDTALAAAFVGGKIRNQRTLLRRLGGAPVRPAVDELTALARRADVAREPSLLLGLEGAAARAYFASFPRLLRRDGDEFSFAGRNRRPPTDPVNAVLSFCYSLLVRDTTVGLLAAGLDPQVGFLHQPRFGRPSLALDLAEEFRPLIGDSTTIMAINNGELAAHDFIRRGGAVALTRDGRRALIAAYERRMAQEVTHPLFHWQGELPAGN